MNPLLWLVLGPFAFVLVSTVLAVGIMSIWRDGPSWSGCWYLWDLDDD